MNPSDVYRHRDSHYQVCYTSNVLQDRRILLTWNRRALDFLVQDQQIFKGMGLRLGLISRRIEKRQHLEKNGQVLCGFVDVRMEAATALSLGLKDVTLLTKLVRSYQRSRIASDLGIRRDSVDKRRGLIRERLGLEIHHQLLSALACGSQNSSDSHPEILKRLPPAISVWSKTTGDPTSGFLSCCQSW